MIRVLSWPFRWLGALSNREFLLVVTAFVFGLWLMGFVTTVMIILLGPVHR